MMSLFDARLRLPGRSRVPLGVEVDVSAERMTLISGDNRLADWRLEDLEIALWTDGFHIKADGEDLVLSVTDPKRFAVEVGLTERQARPSPSASPNDRQPSPGRAVRNGPRVDDLRRRITETAAALSSDTVSPPQAFAQWLGLLKEVNHWLGQGSMSREVFHQLNSELLELIPQPDEAADPAVGH